MFDCLMFRSRESPLYTKYPSQRGDRGDLRREQYSNSRKDIRDTDRERWAIVTASQ